MEQSENHRGTESPGTVQENVFSRRVRAGKRTYFFDVKSTKSVKDLYIVLTESRRLGEEKYEKHKIFLYKEDFSKFIEALRETTQFVEQELLEKIDGQS
ncbi:MAG TPA: DUF3276 family protein [Bacteroidota bacterium]|nr:DUF3276 family protein [Bacteroidota bacterium]